MWRTAAHAVLCAVLTLGLLVAAVHRRLPPLAPETSVAPPGTRAMWLWDPAPPDAVAGWAARHSVTTIFAYYDPRADVAPLTRLRALCDDAGITLDALGGEPAWTTDHATALAWARAAAATGLFRGLHVDVEPYLLPGWQERQAVLVPRLLGLLDELARVGPPVELDVPFWLSTVRVGGQNLADAVLDRVDGVTVMSYRNTATGGNSMLGVADDLLRRAGKAAKPVRLGAETQPLGDCAYCTFHGGTGSAMRETLREVDTAAQRYAAFEGIAVHQYDTWAALGG
ncbi:hypothetical protein Daura_12425 [Dactylosporangium aurantiacum]|uniref:Amidase n=1 Tax=Dactylosporangium aurantiacum TaxID=35754 RepID=A0A9Q9MJG7_9ACTN|nr:hypothetical protein [Dactylosporangium aurantiacum]MDG6104080.1 hypothetical protein [Dactylosporangium aurantiacum]UWZ56905.1 hypothetical protein Daura_12425 [Dactylosporangium aurantiacum]